jgi:hypothetical protein
MPASGKKSLALAAVGAVLLARAAADAVVLTVGYQHGSVAATALMSSLVQQAGGPELENVNETQFAGRVSVMSGAKDVLVIPQWHAFSQLAAREDPLANGSAPVTAAYIGAVSRGVTLIAAALVDGNYTGSKDYVQYLYNIYQPSRAVSSVFSPMTSYNPTAGTLVRVETPSNPDKRVPSPARGFNSSIASAQGGILTSAIAFTAASNGSQFVPCLEGKDAFGRHLGWAASLVSHDDNPGRFSSGTWALLGVRSPLSWYAQPEAAAAVSGVIAAALAGVSIEPAQPQACPCAPRATNPLRWLRKSKDGWHFIDDAATAPGGETSPVAYFALGLDTTSTSNFGKDLRQLAAGYSLAGLAGVNTVRMYLNDPAQVPEQLYSCSLDCAAQNGIRVALHLQVEYIGNEAWIRAHAGRVANTTANESTVMLYDGFNEPKLTQLDAIKLGDGSSGKTLYDAFPYNDVTPHCNYSVWEARLNPGWPSAAFPQLKNGSLATDPDDCSLVYDTLNDMFGNWTSWYAESMAPALSRSGGKQFLGIGYDSIFELFPKSTEMLDAVIHHAYPDIGLSDTFTDTVVATTLDRIRAGRRSNALPAPVIMAETGVSTGDYFDSCEPGKPTSRHPSPVCAAPRVDADSAAVAEAMTWLYALAQGHSGVMRWKLYNNPWAEAVLHNVKDAGLPGMQRDPFTRWHTLQQGRFGAAYFDGTGPRSRPVMHAMSCFSQYLKTFPQLFAVDPVTEAFDGVGNFTFKDAPGGLGVEPHAPGAASIPNTSSTIGAVWEFSEPRSALFRGARAWQDDTDAAALLFRAGGVPGGQDAAGTALHIWWQSSASLEGRGAAPTFCERGHPCTLRVCASSDTTVVIDPQTVARAVAGEAPPPPASVQTLSVLGGITRELAFVR